MCTTSEERRQKEKKQAPITVEKQRAAAVQSFTQLMQQEQRTRGGEQADPVSLYRERTETMRDTAALGSPGFKNITQKQRTRNRKIHASRRLTERATAHTLELHTELTALQREPAVADGREETALRALEQYPFTPQMFVSGMIRSNFREYVSIVRSFEELRARQDPAFADRLEALEPVVTALHDRLNVFCGQNRLALDGSVLGEDVEVASMTQAQLDAWYDAVRTFSQNREPPYDPDGVNLTEEELRRVLSQGGEDEDAPDPEGMTPQQRVEQLPALRGAYARAKEAREAAEGAGAGAEELEALRREEQRRLGHFVLADLEAQLALEKAAGGDRVDELRREAKSVQSDVRRLERRQAREEMGAATAAPREESARRTRLEDTSTHSDQLSAKSRAKLAGLNGAVRTAGAAAAADAVQRYVEGTRYAVGYTEERKRLNEARDAVAKALGDAGLSAEARQALQAVEAYFQEMTNGTLAVPAGAAVEDHAGERPREEGQTRRGSRRNALIRAFTSWKNRRSDPLFAHEPTVNDLKQRLVSNCYMMAATTGLVNLSPALLKGCLRDNGDGTVTVRLYDRRTPPEELERQRQSEKEVAERAAERQRIHEEKELLGTYTAEDELNDEMAEMADMPYIARQELVPVYIRVSKETPQIAGADALSAGALWMQMIEKACAFLGRDAAKGYRSLWYGKGGDFLERLLGVPPETVDRTDPDALFESICSCRERGLVFNAGTGNTGSEEGLNAGHAYAILGGKEENGRRYVLLRNPYSTYSLRYQENGAKERTGDLGSIGSDETYGQFYMEYEDFLRHFQSITSTDLSALLRGGNPPAGAQQG